MKTTFPNDCDNAPKRKLIKDFVIAFYKNRWEDIENLIDDKFEFHIIGDNGVIGSEILKDYLTGSLKISELKINEILSHGKFGACNGEIKGNTYKINFAYFFEFKSAGKNIIFKVSEYKIEQKK